MRRFRAWNRRNRSLSDWNYCEQLDAIMRTVSTFSFGAFALDVALDEVAPLAVEPLVEPVDEAGLSTVPVISTLWPTWAVSFESSASRRYVLPIELADDGVAAPDVPDVPEVEPAVLLVPPDE